MSDVGPTRIPSGLRRSSRSDRVAALRRLLVADDPLVLPGAVDALTARLVETAGFSACYLTGAGLANVQFGLPDVGLVGLGEVSEQLRRLSSATSLPVIADADTGYGGPIAVMRTVHELEQAGVAGIQLEDQQMPKRCGHFDGKRLIPTEEMVAKLLAARDARTAGTVLIARTDARAVEGIDAAIERARAYERAGADVLFVEAPQTVDEMRRVAEALPDTPLLANVVEGGRTPELSVSELGEMGFRVVLFANLLMRVAARATSRALRRLSDDGTSRGMHDDMLSWDERQAMVGLGAVDDLEDHYRIASVELTPKSGGQA